MSEEFNWLDYAEPEESAPEPPQRRGLRRFRPRLPARPRLPRLPGLTVLRRRRPAAPPERSAAELLNDRDEKPLEDLDERLQILRERSFESASPAPDPRNSLYDVDDVLTTPTVLGKPGGVISAAALSRAQEKQVELLKDIVGGVQADEGSDRRARPGLAVFSLSAAPRILISLALLLVVSLPFVSSDFSQGDLPPSDFPPERAGAASVYNALDSLRADDFALVALEYGPTAAGELDALAELVLRHILARGATPLIVSSNPIAIAHAQNILRRIDRADASTASRLQAGRDYHILRFLPGGALGLRELSENFADVARVSHKGQLTGLEFNSLDELAVIALIAERAEDIRNWAEQVASAVEDTTLLAFSGYSAAPLAQIYADSLDEIVGLVVGYRDAFTYNEKLQREFDVLAPAPTEPTATAPTPASPTPAPIEPTQTPTALTGPAPILPTSVPTNHSGVLPGGDTGAYAERAQATTMPLASATPQPSAPPTETPMPTATDPPTATATLAAIRVVEVVAPQDVRIRRGPTTVDDILRLARTGDRFEVLGQNGDGSWYKIALANGLEGWIAEFLVVEKAMTAAEFHAEQREASARLPRQGVFLRWESLLSLGKEPPRYYQAPVPASAELADYALRRDRSAEVPRLEAMTLGTVAAVLAIALGNLVHALAALGRRRGESG